MEAVLIGGKGESAQDALIPLGGQDSLPDVGTILSELLDRIDQDLQAVTCLGRDAVIFLIVLLLVIFSGLPVRFGLSGHKVRDRKGALGGFPSEVQRVPSLSRRRRYLSLEHEAKLEGGATDQSVVLPVNVRAGVSLGPSATSTLRRKSPGRR